MVLATWRRLLNQKLRAFREGAAQSRRPSRATFRPQVTVLENRCLLAVAVDPSANFIGMNQDSIPPDQRVEPPDTIAAAGPSRIVEMVNTSIAFFDKAGNSLYRKDLSQFFAPVHAGPSQDIFDPVVTYDEMAGRFVVAALQESDLDGTSFLLFAVSDDSDPMDGFSEMHRLPVIEFNTAGKALFGDYPKLGWNADAYVFTLNMYQFPRESGPFDHVQIISIDKSSVLDQDPGTITSFDSDRFKSVVGLHFTMAAATMHDSLPGDPMWFVEENGRDFTGGPDDQNLRLVEMTDVLSVSPTFMDLVAPVPRYGPAVDPLQPSEFSPDLRINNRILNVALRGNRLVASQNVGTGAHTIARWYEFNIGTIVPTLVQSGDIDRGPGIDTYYPAIDIAANGDLGMSFMQSSTREYMSMYVTGRTQADPPGVMQTPILVKAGQDIYSGERAGDYSGISVDPENPNTFWAANEYATTASGPGNWGTWIANFCLNGADPNSHISRSRAFVAQIYQDVLHRDVDPSGLASWSALVDQGFARAQVVRLIEMSVEYRTRQVKNIYVTLLGRQADSAGLDNAVAFLGRGGTIEQLKSAILGSPEFFQNRGGGSNAGFLNALYGTVLGRGIDPIAQIHLAQVLDLGIPRDVVARQIVTSREAIQRLVEDSFERFLHRPSDPAGLAGWVAWLQIGVNARQAIVVSDLVSGVSDESFIAKVIGSDEYFERV
jgi:Domain of unknown function (DUF4214)